MIGLLRYMWNDNKRKYIVSFLIFILIIGILFAQMNMKLTSVTSTKQLVLFMSIFTLYICGIIISFIQVISIFPKLLRNSLVRLSTISGKQLVMGMIFLLTAVMFIWDVIGTSIFYISLQFAIPSSELFTNLRELADITITDHVLSSVIEMIKIQSIMIQILFLIVVMKIFTRKKKIQVMLIIVSFLILNTVLKGIYVALGKLTPSSTFIKKIIYSSGDGLDIGMYAGSNINIYNMGFACLVCIVGIYLTAYIIDKKLEV